MKLINSTTWSDDFLRRMTVWCAKQLGMPVRKVKVAQFRNRAKRSYSGHAWWNGRFVVSIGPASRFPLRPDRREGMDGEAMADREEALIAVTAHEIAHLLQYLTGRIDALKRNRLTETNARRQEVMVLREFRKGRETLLAEWSKHREERPVKSVQEQRAEKAQAMFDRWMKKAKLATTKVKAWKRKVRYYERTLGVMAAKRSE